MRHDPVLSNFERLTSSAFSNYVHSLRVLICILIFVVHKRVSPVPPAAHNRESPIQLTGKPLSLAQASLPPGALRPVYLTPTQADLR